MKLSEFRKIGDTYTSKASDIVRQLIIAGIAIIWVFKNKEEGQDTLDPFLVTPLLLLTIAFIADLFQYVVGGRIWGKFYREREKIVVAAYKLDKTVDLDPETKAPKNNRMPINILYNIKIALTCIAFIFIIIFLIKHIDFRPLKKENISTALSKK